jgi:multiple sugar transport system permease protein
MGELALPRPARARDSSLSRRLVRATYHVGLGVVSLAMVMPLVWAIASSFKPEAEIFVVPPTILPRAPTLENYLTAFQAVPIVSSYLNTVTVTVNATVGTLVTSSLAAYAFTRLRFRGRDACFVAIIATMMVPPQITIIPQFVLYQKIGWLDTLLPLIIPPALTNGFGVFLLRQFLKTIPMDYEDAARIDGANPFQIYLRVALPLIKPALAALAVFAFVANWNSYLGPLIFINSPERYTLQLVISAFRGLYFVSYGAMLAATTLSIAPMLLVYALAQRYFVEGIAMGGLRG